MESKLWEYKENFHKLAMSDDYDGHYEVTNGSVSLCTTDDPEDITETENTLQRVANALNESGCKFYCNTTTEHALHIENMELRYKVDELKERCDKMEAALKDIIKISNAGKTLSHIDSHVAAKAREALKEGESNTPAPVQGEKEVDNG